MAAEMKPCKNMYVAPRATLAPALRASSFGKTVFPQRLSFDFELSNAYDI